MAQAEIEVELSKADAVRRYTERIELLFNVSVSLSLCRQSSLVEDGNSLGDQATFLLSSPNSQESVEKAVVFLRAALEESTDFTFDRNCFQPEEFEMVRRSSDAIQRDTLAVLDFDLRTCQMCIKGGRDNVNAAKEQVHSLTDSQHDLVGKEWVTVHDSEHSHQQIQKPLAHQHSPSSISPAGTERGMPFSLQKDSASSPVRDLDNNVIFTHVDSTKTYSLNLDLVSDYCSDLDSFPQLIPRGVPASPVKSLLKSFSQVLALKDKEQDVEEDFHKESPQMSDQGSPSSSDSDIGLMIDKNDKRYLNKLEFAVKLGYSEQDLDRVLYKNGLNCDLNKLLRELIEGSTANNEEAEPFMESLSPAMSDFVSSEEFLGVMQKVTKSDDGSCNLRHIVIDGSNVAMSHGKNLFSCRGIRIAVDWFRQRGHKEITVFVPQWRKETSRPDTPITDQEILTELEKEGVVVFTPARRIKGRRVVCYDDRFVLKLAAETNGIVVSNDTYRDLLNENQEFRTVVEERLLMYTFVNDRFMPPEDPLGRRGPTLDNFLRKEPTNPPPLPPECPYGRKCTYGNKCKYHHPERGTQPHRTVTEVLKEQATLKMQERASKGPEPMDKGRRSKPKLTRTRSLVPGEAVPSEKMGMTPLPPGLQEPDQEVQSKLKSPIKSPGKTADYLREHRKKLEEALAVGKALGAAPDSQGNQEAMVQRATEAASPRLPEPAALTPVSTFGSRVSSPSRLNVPYSDNQEGGLVSGHLLLAKKLSDESAESSFFAAESSSNRASPVALAGPAVSGFGRQESMPVPHDRFPDRRMSLQDAQHYHLPVRQQLQSQFSSQFAGDADQSMSTYLSGPSRLPSQYHLYQQDQAYSMSAYSGQCQSFPEQKTAHGALRRVTSYVDHPPATSRVAGDIMHHEHSALKTQISCPMNPFFPQTPASSRPLGNMMRQNSSSDPQLHMTATSEPHYSTWMPTTIPTPPASLLESGHLYSSQGAQGDMFARQNLFRSTSVQPLHHTMPFSPAPTLDRQISEGMFGSRDSYPSQPSFYPYPVEGSLFPSLPSTPTAPGTPSHFSPGYRGVRPSGAWQQDTQVMPSSPVKPAHRSYPRDQAIPPTDQRYPLYSHLCTIFAEPRVRAAMNLYPDENEPQKLVNIIMQIQL